MTTEFKKTVLENGIRVISEEIPTVRSVSIGAWVNVGSRDETPNVNGISHFIEHMVFKGTPRRSAQEIAASLESVGGHLNAFTSREQTCFYAKVLDEHPLNAIDVLSDVMLNSLFLDDDIKKEKGVVIEEIHDVQDAPSELIHDLFAEAYWDSNSLGFPILGTTETVSNFSRDDMVSFMDNNYTANRMIITACGNLKHSDLLKMVEDHFKIKNSNHSKMTNRKKSPKKGRTNCFAKDIAQAHVSMGLPTYTFDDERRNALLILNNVLGGGMSSRLFQTVREQAGLVYTISSFMDFFMDEGIMGVYFATSAGQVQRTLELIYQVLDGIKHKKLTDKELYYSKSQLKGNLVLGLENTSNRMNRMARHEILLGDYINIDETIAAIDRVTKEEILDVAEEVLNPDLLNIAALGRVEQEELIPYE
ncbi:MAG: hypothetical protein GF315_06975 [candidate division Zixibacteria bacterium]|nr:hypothetical protein [candidate division Zixibacteria bacterium]